MHAITHQFGPDQTVARSTPPTGERGAAERWFWPVLLGIIVVGAALRFFLLAQYWANDPFSARPSADAMTYWEWAGRIAAGQLADSEPFFSGPLYPYLVGLVRVCGGGLVAVYAIQILLDLVTAGLLAWIGRRQFGVPVGLLSAGLFLLLLEPASFSLRILSSTLQLPLVCLSWMAMLAAQQRPSLWRGVGAGAALGLLAMSYPPAIVCVPIFGLCWWWSAGRGWPAVWHAAAAVLAGVVVISPATIHNYRACGEIIAISAQAGVTFAHGNAPASVGVYTPLSDVSIRRDTQNADTRRVYREATGQEPTWNGVNGFFFKRGLDCWRSDPSAAVRLFARKAYWFLTGRNYSEIYWPTLEQADGLLTRLCFMPLHTAWLIPPALLAIVVWLRRPRTHLPELLLFGVPLLIVVVFWFSPRYRLPAIPVIVVGCAWALWQGSAWRARRKWTAVVAAAVLLGIGLGLLNSAAGFDSIDRQRGLFWCQVGDSLRTVGRQAESVDPYRKGLALTPENAVGAANLGRVLIQLGRRNEAIAYLSQAVRYDPANTAVRCELGQALLAENRPDDALQQLQEVLRRDPKMVFAHIGVSQILYASGDIRGGIAALRRAQELAPESPDLANDLAWLLATTPGLSETEHAGAVHIAQQALAKIGDKDPGVLDTLAAALASDGRFTEAVAAMEQALARAQEQGDSDKVERFRQRLELYKSGQPYLAPPPRPGP